jgi:hypothetical protein
MDLLEEKAFLVYLDLKVMLDYLDLLACLEEKVIFINF